MVYGMAQGIAAMQVGGGGVHGAMAGRPGKVAGYEYCTARLGSCAWASVPTGMRSSGEREFPWPETGSTQELTRRRACCVTMRPAQRAWRLTHVHRSGTALPCPFRRCALSCHGAQTALRASFPTHSLHPQAGASAIQVNVGRIRDWYNSHPGVQLNLAVKVRGAGGGCGGGGGRAVVAQRQHPCGMGRQLTSMGGSEW